ncbi:helix-turn-helix domain-containing protein [Dyadobacter tibetensis]|uniref:helix-turn-helix domain-containing protein n=1 Tax=Dyadobacter tibetensis TaxID=1211851 RepID=UPI0004701661|nr:helix-turn-helix transcriptional regulator [Dyadobacter tibetensis]
MSIVSNNIKYLRRLNGLTQEQFAKKIAIKRSLLGAYEEARANPNITNLKNMAAAFGVSVDNLLKNDLRRLRETPDTLLPLNVSRQTTISTASNTGPSSNRLSVLSEPQPLEKLMDKFSPVAPEIRTVSRQVNLKPIHGHPFHTSSNIPPTRTDKQPYTHHSPVRDIAEAGNERGSIPVFNNHYDPIQTEAKNLLPKSHYPSIQWVSLKDEATYLKNLQNPQYIAQLPVFSLPNLDQGYYRAFESGPDFPLPDSILIGTFVGNWYDIRHGEKYVLVLKRHGIVYRQVANQVKQNGTLLAMACHNGIADMEIPIQEVLEVWAIQAYVGKQMPSSKPSLDKLSSLANELKTEIDRFQTEMI